VPTGLGQNTFVAGYRIVDVLGAGGMGVVYRAHQTSLDRNVALKVISPPLLEEDRFRRCFERESTLAASIEHPHVLPVYEAGEHEGLMFIAMQLVPGCDLGRLIATDWPLDPVIAVRIVSQVASALDAAHARGLVHRDVKPANVLIAERGGGLHAYLADFGLCSRAGSHTGLTGAGGFVGTPDFVAPEQITGAPVDGRADVYALGCVLFKLLTGEPPFGRDEEFWTLWAHVREDPPAVSATAGVPPSLDAVLRRALAKDADERYRSAGELARDAVAALGGHEETGPTPFANGSCPPSLLRRARTVVRWPRALLVAALAAAAALALVATTSHGGYEKWSPPSREEGRSASVMSKARGVSPRPATACASRARPAAVGRVIAARSGRAHDDRAP
jgi:serine/threonine protein kinase